MITSGVQNSYCSFPTLGINCGPLDEPQNGFVSFRSTGEVTTATYSCKPGFVLEPGGENIRVCNRSGNWTGSVLECKSMSISEFTYFAAGVHITT